MTVVTRCLPIAHEVASKKKQGSWGTAVDITSLLNPLLTTPASISTERKKRRDQFNRQTVSHADAVSLLAAGWQHDRKLKFRTRVMRPKSIDEELENRAWVLLAELGFHELSHGRQFKIRFKRNNKIDGEKQVDIFGKDGETVIVAECKASSEIRKRSLQKDIEELSNLKGKISDSIRQHYGSAFKPKIIWAIITEKIIWSKEDKDRARGENISVITERELRYFIELARHLGPAGRYQFLAHFLAGQKLPALEDKRVPALRGKLGGKTFYTFVTTPERLLKIAFVNHRTLNDPQGIPTYQRLITKGRLKGIHGFLDDGGYFPTNIIVNFTSKPKFELRLKEEEADIHYGTLYLPDKYKSAWIIDGQHRLYGYTRLTNLQKSHNIIVLAFEKLQQNEEANLFVTINHEQKTVPRTLLDDLQGELKWESENPRERLVAICSRLVTVLNGEIGGPFYLRVVQTGLRGTKETCLTLPALIEGLRKSELLGHVHKRLGTYQPGPFTGKNDFETLDRARHGLEDIFSLLKDANPTVWQRGLDGSVCTNTGISAVLMIISEAIKYYEEKTKLDAVEQSPEEIAEQIQDVIVPIIDKLKQCSEAQISKIFKENVPYGSRGPRELFLKLVGIVREKVDNFGPKDFDQWRNEQTLERSKDVSDKIQDLNSRICEFIFNTFRKYYGEQYYFDKGVTNKEFRTSAYAKMQDTPIEERGQIEEYLDLIEYKKIVEKSEHWNLFTTAFNIRMSDEKLGQAKYLKWMDRLNDVRKKAAHKSVGRQLTESDMETVEWIYEAFHERLAAAHTSTSGAA